MVGERDHEQGTDLKLGIGGKEKRGGGKVGFRIRRTGIVRLPEKQDKEKVENCRKITILNSRLIIHAMLSMKY